jgi:hypothetical protein
MSIYVLSTSCQDGIDPGCYGGSEFEFRVSHKDEVYKPWTYASRFDVTDSGVINFILENRLDTEYLMRWSLFDVELSGDSIVLDGSNPFHSVLLNFNESWHESLPLIGTFRLQPDSTNYFTLRLSDTLYCNGIPRFIVSGRFQSILIDTAQGSEVNVEGHYEVELRTNGNGL